MKRIRAFLISTKLIGTVLLLVVAAAPTVSAEFECRQELWAGTWATHAELWILQREGMDIFPPPGPFSTVALVVLDEEGRVTFARQTNSTSLGVSRLPDVTRINDIQLTIDPDCTGKQLFSLRNDLPPEHPVIAQFGLQPGQAVFELDLVCADGQKECWATFTKPAGILIGIAKMKRVEPFDQKVAAELDATKELVRKIAAALGVLRRGE